MGNVELKDVVCCFKQMDNEKELVHIALNVEEAKQFISSMAKSILKEMDLTETAINVDEHGVTISHLCDKRNNCYDFRVELTFSETYAKLLVGG